MSVRSLLGVSQESVRSQSGVSQESIRSQSEICQESDGNHICWADLESSPEFGELIWMALQIKTWCHFQQITAIGLVCMKSAGSHAGSLLTSSRLQQILESSLFSYKHIRKKQRCCKETRPGDHRKTRIYWKDMKVYIRKD